MNCAPWWLGLVIGLLAACSEAPRESPLKLNDLQVVATHNSYKQAIDPALLRLLSAEFGDVINGLDYAHAPLRDQLDAGIRKLELDVFHDPEGARYAAPRGLALLQGAGLPAADWNAESMLAPGMKVMHVQDIDFRSHCPTLERCLAELREWSEAHPDHLPIAVSVNAKDGPLDDPDATVPLPFDTAAWAALDAEIVAGLGAERLLRPDDVRGNRETLREAVLADGWPALDALRGRFLFVLDEPMAKLAGYLEDHPALAGRVMFANVPEAHPAAGFLIINDPLAEGKRIREAVQAGFSVRTRADADTLEARRGDTRRMDAAFASGAHFVSTDYPSADPRFGTDYAVRLPGGGSARCNPVRRAEGCLLEAERD